MSQSPDFTYTPTEQLMMALDMIRQQLAIALSIALQLAKDQPPVPPYVPVWMRQIDPLYAGKHYGGTNSPYTIGGSGCLLASCCNLINVVSRFNDATPATLQDALAANGGYAAEVGTGLLAMIIYDHVSLVYPVVKFTDAIPVGAYPVTATQFTEIDQRLAVGVPVILGVSIKTGTGFNPHFVLAISGSSATGYQIIDPAYTDAGLIDLVSRYPEHPGWAKTPSGAIEKIVLYDKVMGL
jgi:hypothetical protein